VYQNGIISTIKFLFVLKSDALTASISSGGYSFASHVTGAPGVATTLVGSFLINGITVLTE